MLLGGFDSIDFDGDCRWKCKNEGARRNLCNSLFISSSVKLIQVSNKLYLSKPTSIDTGQIKIR